MLFKMVRLSKMMIHSECLLSKSFDNSPQKNEKIAFHQDYFSSRRLIMSRWTNKIRHINSSYSFVYISNLGTNFGPV